MHGQWDNPLRKIWAGFVLAGLALVGATVWVAKSAPTQGDDHHGSLQADWRRQALVRPVDPPMAATELPALRIPVAGVMPGHLQDTFTQAREAGARQHDAIDIIAPRGTPVLASASGVIEKMFLSRAGGTSIYERLPDRRIVLYYAHLDSYAPGLSEGQWVKAGQQIGTVGSTGNADPNTPHLHFAILQLAPQGQWHSPNQPINPYPVFIRAGR